MALAVDASSPAKATQTAGSGGCVTASFTAPSASLLVAFTNTNSPASTGENKTVTDSGGLTWTLQKRINFTTGSGTEGGAEVWTATTVSSAARTVTSTPSGSTANHNSLVVKVLTDSGGAPTPGASNSSTSTAGLPTCNVTTTAANSWVWACSSDWAQAGLGTAGSGQTITTTDENNVAGQYTGHVWRQTATTAGSGTVVTMNLTGPAAQRYDMVVLEIKANSGAAATSSAPVHSAYRILPILVR